MTTPGSLNSFLAWLGDEITAAKETVADNKGFDRNSYGAGYDSGFLAGLQAIHQYYMGDDA
jgi:hypothetical protein